MLQQFLRSFLLFIYCEHNLPEGEVYFHPEVGSVRCLPQMNIIVFFFE